MANKKILQTIVRGLLSGKGEGGDEIASDRSRASGVSPFIFLSSFQVGRYAPYSCLRVFGPSEFGSR